MNLRNRKSEKDKEQLRRLAQKDGNRFCFDCATRGPLYVVTNYHILVCSTCSAAHRSFQHKVKGISMSEFTDEEVVGVAVCGNDRAEKIWLASFKGNRPRPGHDRSIFTFVESVFERGSYKNSAELRTLEQDIKEELNPSLKKSTPAPAAPAAPAAAAVPPPPEPQPRQPTPTAQPTPQAPQAPPAKPHDVFDDIFAAPAAPPPQQQQPPPQHQQQQQQQWNQDPPQFEHASILRSFLGSAMPQPPQQPQLQQQWTQQPPAPVPAQQWGPTGPAAPMQTSPYPQSQPQQPPQQSSPSSPSGGGRIRVLAVSSGSIGSASPVQGAGSPPQQQPQSQSQQQPWGQSPPPQQHQQQQQPYWNQGPPQQQQQQWGQAPPPPQPPQQTYSPQQAYPPQQANPPPQQAYPPYNTNHSDGDFNFGNGGNPQNVNFLQAQNTDPWGSGAPMMMMPSQPPQQEEKKPDFDNKVFAGLNPF